MPSELTAAASTAAAAGTTSTPWYSVVLAWMATNLLAIVLIIVISLLVWWLLLRVITRVTQNAKDRLREERPGQARAAEHTQELTAVLMSARREQRAEALGQLLKSIATFTVLSIGLLLILAQIGVNLGPLIASAGVIGVALGFGAQTMVKDFLSGVFLVLEDQFGVGDFVDLGPATGTVEEVTLRITRVRDMSGVVWYVRNGEILRVANQSQGWTLASVDIPIAYDESLDVVREAIQAVAEDMYADPQYDEMLLGKPSFAGVESVSGDAMFIRVLAKAAPEKQIPLTRAIRVRIKEEFDRRGVRVPVVARPFPPGSQPPAAK